MPDYHIEILISEHEKRGDGMGAYVTFKIVVKVRYTRFCGSYCVGSSSIIAVDCQCPGIHEERIYCMAAVQ